MTEAQIRAFVAWIQEKHPEFWEAWKKGEAAEAQESAPELPARPEILNRSLNGYTMTSFGWDWHDEANDYMDSLEAQLRAANERAEAWETRYTVLARAEANAARLSDANERAVEWEENHDSVYERMVAIQEDYEKEKAERKATEFQLRNANERIAELENELTLHNCRSWYIPRRSN